MVLALILHSFLGVLFCVCAFIWKKIQKVKAKVWPYFLLSVGFFILAMVIDKFDRHADYYFDGLLFWACILSCYHIGEFRYFYKCYNNSTPERKEFYDQKLAEKAESEKNSAWKSVPLIIRVVIWIIGIVILIQFVLGFFGGLHLGIKVGLS